MQVFPTLPSPTTINLILVGSDSIKYFNIDRYYIIFYEIIF